MKVEVISIIATSVIAIVGWIIAIVTMVKNRKWQKKDLLANRRYEAYSNFLKKLDEIHESIRKPDKIYEPVNEFTNTLTNGNLNEEEISKALLRFCQKTLEHITTSAQSSMIIKQEINPLFLVASSELTKKLKKLQILLSDLYNDMQNRISAISVNDPNSFKCLEDLGQDTRFDEFNDLHNDIVTLMRKETIEIN